MPDAPKQNSCAIVPTTPLPECRRRFVLLFLDGGLCKDETQRQTKVRPSNFKVQIGMVCLSLLWQIENIPFHLKTLCNPARTPIMRARIGVGLLLVFAGCHAP